jgi:hypothetical protein
MAQRRTVVDVRFRRGKAYATAGWNAQDQTSSSHEMSGHYGHIPPREGDERLVRLRKARIGQLVLLTR